MNGALTAVRVAHVDIVGVITLGVITAVGGGTFADWRYLAVAAGGGLIAFFQLPVSSTWPPKFSTLGHSGV